MVIGGWFSGYPAEDEGGLVVGDVKRARGVERRGLGERGTGWNRVQLLGNQRSSGSTRGTEPLAASPASSQTAMVSAPSAGAAAWTTRE
jgi:hypothetical protein